MRLNNWRYALMGTFVCSIMLACIGCSSDGKKAQELFQQNGNGTQKDTQALHLRIQKVRSIFNSVPATVELIQLLKTSKARYSESFPSDPSNVSKYVSVKGQALNLGIYGADLAYAGIYEQKEEASLYLQCANKLATSLGIPQAFNENIISRIEANMGSQDSLLTIIVQDYWNTDTYLTKGDRQQVSAYLIAGGWLEGFYIATQVAAQTGSSDVAAKVASQKLALEDLIALVQTYPSDAKMQNLLTQLIKIQNAFSGVQVDRANPSAAKLTPEQLKSITDIITVLRNQVVTEY